ncbi:MAG: GTP-binding protein [Acidithiobacillus sp.]|jgi:signal recognition particle receptor subunit beta|uniref:GTP-binding protein n=1 Tax=Acidithiobacillus sp. TaxID=1872118 RepID=UPI0025C65785|nr:ATP/GTP-binding protein [Acidithiobacillus sp.]
MEEVAPVRKVIIAGPVGSGKTTALQSLFDGQALTTDARHSEAEGDPEKKTTTVAMDYGVISCPDRPERVHVYAIPGQERFQFMWEILGRNTDGLIVLLDVRQPEPIAALHLYLEKILPYLKRPAVVVGLNKLAPEEREALQMPPYLRHGDLRLRLAPTDVRDRPQVLHLLRLLLAEMVPGATNGRQFA